MADPLAPYEGTAGLAPWISVRDGAAAVDFYKRAFGATELYRLAEGDRVDVAQLGVGGADFWVQHDSDGAPRSTDAGSVRMILTVDEPDALMERALSAGANEVTPMQEGHGWRIGRVVDPFGHHWEIGTTLTNGP